MFLRGGYRRTPAHVNLLHLELSQEETMTRRQMQEDLSLDKISKTLFKNKIQTKELSG
jgi:hypothetical protein